MLSAPAPLQRVPVPPLQPEAPQEAASAPQAAEEISFDDIDIDLPDLNTLESAPVQEAQAEDEISFEGLEDLFKDEK